MPVYRGIVKGNVVVFTEPAGLPDGAEVEVRVVLAVEASPPDAMSADERAREDAFERRLLARGLISGIPIREPDPPWIDRTAIDVDGPPLSQTIIEERR